MNYVQIYESLIARAKNRVISGYVERHHIVPRCMGGLDDCDNLIALTAREHFVGHLLLARIYDSHGLWTAVHLMSRRGEQGFNSRKYQWARLRFAVKHSEFAKNAQGTLLNTPRSIRRMLETKRTNGTFAHSVETKRKISEATMGRTIPPCTDQKRQKNSETSKGRKWLNDGTDSCMAKGEQIEELLSQGWVLGRLRTQSFIEGAKRGGQLIGGYNKGIPMSDEQKQKLSEINKGKPSPVKGCKRSDEFKEKVRQSHLGKTASLETRAKQSASAKGIHAGKKYINKDGIIKHIRPSDVQLFLQDGWAMGKIKKSGG